MKTILILILLIGSLYLQAGELAYGDDLHWYDIDLFPVELKLKCGDTLRVFTELYPLREMRSYQTRSVKRGEDVLNYLSQNVAPDDSFTVYREIFWIPSLWVTGESQVASLKLKDVSEARLQVDSPEESIFANSYELSSSAILKDVQYQKLKQPIVSSICVDEALSATYLYSMNSSLTQKDLYLFSRFLMNSNEAFSRGFETHPSYSDAEIDELSDQLESFCEGSDQHNFRISTALSESSVLWQELAAEIDNLEMLSSEQNVICKTTFLSQAEECLSAKKMLDNIRSNGVKLLSAERERLFREYFQCLFPYLSLPSPEDYDWGSYLLSKDVVAFWLQID